MIAQAIEDLGFQAIVFLIFILGFIFALLSFVLWMSWKREGRRGDVSPYTKSPMRLGGDVARSLAEQVNAFLEEQPQPGNPPIDFELCSYCPITGRCFPLTVSPPPFEQVSLSWDFIKRRSSGTFVSWGSLSEEERGVLKLLHDSVDEFQTENSSSHPRPEDVEEQYALLSPGPLYVDRQTKILLGWKRVPGTYFEVFVLQRPRYEHIDETL